jgi:hypothetical protein
MRVLTVCAGLLAIVLASFAATPVRADGTGCGGCLEGFGCDNHCPLAQQANAWRAVGTECLTVRSKVQADHVATVTKNLARI